MVIVVDSSAWIDLIRGRRTPVASALERLIEGHADIAITETIFMEVLAGATSGESLSHARTSLIGRSILRLEGLGDFEEAARIYRACRAAGETIRNQIDCLIAVPTIRHGASLLHNDRDFETIAQHTTLKLEPLDASTRPDALRERAGRYARRRGTRAVRRGGGAARSPRSPRSRGGSPR